MEIFQSFFINTYLVVKRALIVIFGVLILDQVLKIWVKTNMHIGDHYNILGDWFVIHFIENNGMAFGMEFAGKYGKILLSLFRVVAISAISWYLFARLIKNKVPKGLIISVSLILAGAIGNLIDSAFYGMIFNESYSQIASFFPEEGGYAPFLYGKVVDMLYFPVIEGTFPDWFPIWSNEPFLFFRPIFNIADSSVTVGVLMVLIFQKRYFPKNEVDKAENIETGA